MVQSARRLSGAGGRFYVPGLDGLRAVSIGFVVLSHAGLGRVLPGAFGVTLFFFISGKLITGQLLDSLETTGRVGLGGFYLRRALRLMPAGVVYVLVAGLFYRLAGGEIPALGWLCALAYGANSYELWVGYRSTLAGVRHPFNILWSLAIEEHFYLVWPWVLPALLRHRVAIAGVLALCVAALAWRFWLFGHCSAGAWQGVCGAPPHDPAFRYNRLYLGTDTRFDSILYGALLALDERLRPVRTLTGPRMVAAACLVLAASFLLPGAELRYVMRMSMQGLALLVLVPACIEGRHAVSRLLACAPVILVGRLSYSLYLWHWGAFALADWAMPGDPRRLVMLGLPLAWGFAVLSYVGIEQPMLRLRRRFGSHAPLDVLGGSRSTLGEAAHAAASSA